MLVLFDTSQLGGVHVAGPIGAPSHMQSAGLEGEHVTTEFVARADESNAATSIAAAPRGGGSFFTARGNHVSVRVKSRK